MNEEWAPKSVCCTCFAGLSSWYKGKRKGLAFGEPMIWSKPQDHISDCYFCLVDTSGFNRKNKTSISYPDCRSVIKPKSHCETLPYPTITKIRISETGDYGVNDDIGLDYLDEHVNEPQRFSQNELSDLISL